MHEQRAIADCASMTRPAMPGPDTVIRETDTGRVLRWTGREWIDDIVSWLSGCYDRAEVIALAASKPYAYAEGNPVTPPDGVHWQWCVGENWDPAEPDLVGEEYVADGDQVYLLSRETWLERRWSPECRQDRMPRNYLDADRVDSAAGLFIIRHDPAWRIADIRRKRARLQRHRPTPRFDGTLICKGCSVDGYGVIVYHPCIEIRTDAEEFAGEPGYDEAWRPERG